MQQYLDLLKDIMDNGEQGPDRTGTGTRSSFGRQLRYNLKDGFPLLSTKRVPLRVVAEELFWMLRGETNNNILKEKNVKIWEQWCTEDGELGPIYGAQWHDWKCSDGSTFNQIDYVVDTIKNNPKSRRIIMQGWNPEFLPDESISPQENVKMGKMAITCCHVLYQWKVINNRISGMVTIRSNDLLLGHPFNTASLALLTCMLAQQCDLEVGDCIVSIGDAHIYNNHVDQVREQLTRDVRPLPKLSFNRKPDSIYDYKWEDIVLEGYDPHPPIKAPVAV